MKRHKEKNRLSQRRKRIKRFVELLKSKIYVLECCKEIGHYKCFDEKKSKRKSRIKKKFTKSKLCESKQCKQSVATMIFNGFTWILAVYGSLVRPKNSMWINADKLALDVYSDITNWSFVRVWLCKLMSKNCFGLCGKTHVFTVFFGICRILVCGDVCHQHALKWKHLN